MNSKGVDFLKKHESKKPSRFIERANWRKENASWLQWSRNVATAIMKLMQEKNLSRSDIAKQLDVTPQYVSRILSGRENFSFKTIDAIQTKLGIVCFEATAAM